MIWIGLALVVVPAILLFRGLGRANGWVYEVLQEFFSETLKGHRHQGSLSKVLAMLGAIVLGILGVLLISWIF